MPRRAGACGGWGLAELIKPGVPGEPRADQPVPGCLGWSLSERADNYGAGKQVLLVCCGFNVRSGVGGQLPPGEPCQLQAPRPRPRPPALQWAGEGAASSWHHPRLAKVTPRWGPLALAAVTPPCQRSRYGALPGCSTRLRPSRSVRGDEQGGAEPLVCLGRQQWVVTQGTGCDTGDRPVFPCSLQQLRAEDSRLGSLSLAVGGRTSFFLIYYYF